MTRSISRTGAGLGLAACIAWMGGCVADTEDIGASRAASGYDPPVCFEGECIPEGTPIYAGRHIEIGEATVTSVDGELVVTITTGGGWSFSLAHLYVGTTPPPTNRGGNVAPGRFPYHYRYRTPVTTDTVRVSLEDVGAGCGDSLYVAIHLEAWRDGWGEETAWAHGTPFGGPQWGWYFHYDVCCSGPETCVRPADHWATDPPEWWRYITKMGFGGVLYPKTDLLAFLAMDPAGDASIALAQQRIALKLNWYCGVTVDDETWALFIASGSWFYRNADADGLLPFGTDPTSPEGMDALYYAGQLQAFNEGLGAVPACAPPVLTDLPQ